MGFLNGRKLADYWDDRNMGRLDMRPRESSVGNELRCSWSGRPIEPLWHAKITCEDNDGVRPSKTMFRWTTCGAGMYVQANKLEDPLGHSGQYRSDQMLDYVRHDMD